ncbi:uncharacterized protein MYCFIDRAFT_192094 [Pseudocercospora fijiensis CIRAD86]|uniref:Uncharacterized protein n=1 Tax=Pseudocercospora fijiensis (strain CIRAD86) TaxID=383855 RepID=N1Q694_PSEFD|nr:uncharacterized protein MYCFIDRAFT_192094 [Pseudocercospora fijiensis CIRAD86]EME87754.1 hypothetical protein MYCFIDRAFT_192094 [Pseudocercospora fijiensis CIRAD86]
MRLVGEELLVPPFIKHDGQDALALDLNSSKWSIIDFGSGQGGAIAIIEKVINHGRDSPIPSILTDLHPNLDVWMELATHYSRALSFIPQPVDAANPRYAAISTTTRGDEEAASQAGFESNGRKVFGLFGESFRRFDDAYAVNVLKKSTLESADAFAIVELRERRLFALVAELLETWLFLIFWDGFGLQRTGCIGSSSI